MSPWQKIVVERDGGDSLRHVVSSGVLPMPGNARPVENLAVRLTFLGAAGTVSGSQYLLEAAGRRAP
jgi:hypothetical protein